jgi:LPXTG-site transpeptidase (sortase) family protein
VAPSLSDRDIIRTAREGVVLYPNGVSPGEAGRIFIAGHSTYWKGKYKFIFRKLNQLTLGDLIHLDWKGQRYTYQVRAKTTVNPRRQKMIPADTDLATLALITCTPLWTTKKRLVVYATLVRVDKLALTPLP